MSKPKSNFRQADVERAISATKAGGLAIARIEVDARTNRISLIMPDEEHELGAELRDLATTDPASAIEKFLERKRQHP